jgi:hypothetical protein
MLTISYHFFCQSNNYSSMTLRKRGVKLIYNKARSNRNLAACSAGFMDIRDEISNYIIYIV